MSNDIRWGILGTGMIARAFAEALQETPGATLAAVASRTVQGARDFAAGFGTPQVFGSYQELAGAAGVDIVYIATPHPMHAANALMCLAGGKAVLCEKPFTMNRREAEQVVALARSRQLFLMEAMLTRFMPSLAEVRRVIASGEIGAVHQVTADFGFSATTDPAHRVNNPDLGGGALLDLGIYPLSIATALLGPVAQVRAQAEMGPSGVDIQTAFTLRHAGGGMSICSCSLNARTPTELTVSGELGHVRMNTSFPRTALVTVATEKGTRTVSTPYLGTGYVYEAIEAGRCLRAGLIESPVMALDESLALMGILDDIRNQIGLRYQADE